MHIETERLLLNRFNESDAERVAMLAGDKRVVEMTSAIPYPYSSSMALLWIKKQQWELDDKEKPNYVYAIRLKESGNLIGCINLATSIEHNRGLVGYWLGHNFWGHGYCTEALQHIIKFGFEEKKLNRIWAQYKIINPASGRVMEKVGMKDEGVMREHYLQDGRYIDIATKSILLSEFV